MKNKLLVMVMSSAAVMVMAVVGAVTLSCENPLFEKVLSKAVPQQDEPDGGDEPVPPPPPHEDSITLNKTALTLAIGASAQLTATAQPGNTAADVWWVSNNPDAVSVDEAGQLTAHKRGEVTIKAKSKTGGKAAACDVYVPANPGLYEDNDGESKDIEESKELEKAFAWIKNNGKHNGEYTIVLGKSETVTAGFGIGSGTSSIAKNTGTYKNVKITLQGTQDDIYIEMKAAGALFTVYGSEAEDIPELVLDKNITLKGYAANNSALVVIGSSIESESKKGKLEMHDDCRITENVSSTVSGGGVCVMNYSSFTMKGGIIDNNVVAVSNGRGGGVFSNGIFTMFSGIIENNVAGTSTASIGIGGGVNSHANTAIFTMNGGSIRNNKAIGTSANRLGGGVYVSNFSMSGNAEIAYNEANRGGGIYYFKNDTFSFNISGGVIKNNKAASYGAAIYFQGTNGTALKKTGGVIYGNSGEGANTDMSGGATVHAIQVTDNGKYHDTMTGQNDNFDVQVEDSYWTLPE